MATLSTLVRVDVPEIGACARIEFRFAEPENLGPDELRAEIYDRALMMLDPA